MDDWEARNRQLVMDGSAILERTGESLARSTAIAVETEAIGNEVVNELGEQRESLLRTRNRLEDANSQLDGAKAVLVKMGRSAIYNKLVLVMIIILEVCILVGWSYIKFVHKKK